MDDLREWLNEGRGRLTALAKACRITHGAVSQWDKVPDKHVLVVERETGIRRERLRPDLYGELEAAE